MGRLQKCLIIALVLCVLMQSFGSEAAPKQKRDDQGTEGLMLTRSRRSLAQLHVGSFHYNHQGSQQASRRNGKRFKSRVHTEPQLASA